MAFEMTKNHLFIPILILIIFYLIYYLYLTTKLKPPNNLKSLLGLGLKFIPTPRRTTSWSQLGGGVLLQFAQLEVMPSSR